MAEESFLLVSLKESKAKKLAEVISNETCRKILDFLATKKSATETQISKQLDIPISTVHYNLKHLVDNNLIKADEFHYSEKGKEVNHYSLTNKLIIIAPKRESKMMDKLKTIIPVALIAAVAAGIIHFMSGFTVGFQRAAMDTEIMAVEKMAAEAAVPTTTTTTLKAALLQQSSLALWFLFGAVFTIIIYLVWDWVRKR